MKNRTKLMIGGAIIFIALTSALMFMFWTYLKRLGERSCVLSVHSSIISQSKKPKFKLDTDIGPDWVVLNDDESEQLILAAAKDNKLDCNEWTSGRIGLDYWNNRLRIAARQSLIDHTFEFKVWSNGPDGVSGTSDDISTENNPR